MITQQNIASSRDIVSAKKEPDHLLVLVHGLEVLPYNSAVRYDVGTEIERQGRYEHARNHVGAHEPLERNAGGKHGDYLGV